MTVYDEDLAAELEERRKRNETIINMVVKEEKIMADVARELRISRNIVIGVMQRYKTNGGVVPDLRKRMYPMAGQEKPKKDERKKKPRGSFLLIDAKDGQSLPPDGKVFSEHFNGTGKRSLSKAQERDCRWVFNDGKICADETVLGYSWCAHHKSLVFQPPRIFESSKRKRRRA